jgi:dTDP-4-amino-4,6-dideoxygalactose transaminase
VARVLDSGWFILGRKGGLRAELAASSRRARRGRGQRDGGDPARLEALGLAAGDEVVTSPLTAAFTALAILRAGARPVFADVDPVTLNVSPETLERAITPHTRALLPVHLYGHPVDLDPMIEMARRRGIPLVEDACQAIGAQYKGRPVGVISGIGALSFYPTKNLGAFGDGGAVVVEDPEIATRLRRLRNGGQSDRYRHDVAGINSRLDEMQAALLRVKLGHLAAWTDRRRGLAARYEGLRDAAGIPVSSRMRARPLPSTDPLGAMPRRSADRDPHPLPHPAAPAARLRGAGEEARGLPGGGARRGRDPLHPALPGDDGRPGGGGDPRDPGGRAGAALSA